MEENKHHSHSILLLLLLLLSLTLTFLPSLVTSQACRSTCSNIPIKYPFGTGLGCGDPRFQKYVNCDQNKLTLTTHTGCYPITNIDYTSQVIYISDPSMSTCSCARPSKGFGLDWDAPFSFHDNTVFTLLNCEEGTYGNGSRISLRCDPTGAPICSFLYSCQAIGMMNQPISTCCVYAPVDLGPSFEMDLAKLQCSSYSGFYEFNGQEPDPNKWKYGVAIKYKFNVYNDYPGPCANCERSNGVCGYGGSYNSFLCNCASGFNTTSDCFFGSDFGRGAQLDSSKIGAWLIIFLAWFLVSALV